MKISILTALFASLAAGAARGQTVVTCRTVVTYTDAAGVLHKNATELGRAEAWQPAWTDSTGQPHYQP